MEIALIQNGNITKIGDYRDVFPSTSFASNGPSDEWLVANGAKKVSRFKSYDPLTQKLVQVAAHEDGDFVSLVQVQSLTANEIQDAKDTAMAQLRSNRNNLLTQCDWTQIPDCSIPNKEEWATYRQQLRNFPSSVEDARLSITWPTKPE